MKNQEEINQEIIKEHIKKILEDGLHQQVEGNPHLEETPDRVARAMAEIFSGYVESPYDNIKTFPNESEEKQVVILGPMTLYSMCSHHMLPFHMDIYVGYVPDKKIIGISKIERVSKNICRKLQVQEKISYEIMDVLTDILEPQGVIVYITNSLHTCMTMRGIQSRNAGLTTLSKNGIFENKQYQDEFFEMIKNGK